MGAVWCGVDPTSGGDGCAPDDSLAEIRLGCDARSLTATGRNAVHGRSGCVAVVCGVARGMASSRYAAGNCLYNVRHAGIPRRRMGVGRLSGRTSQMTNSKMWRVRDIVPSISYSDVPRAAEWLARVFGLHERAEPPQDLRERSTLAYPCGGVTIRTRRKRARAEDCGVIASF